VLRRGEGGDVICRGGEIRKVWERGIWNLGFGEEIEDGFI